MEIIRIYKNSGDTIRVDTLSVNPRYNTGKVVTYQADNGENRITYNSKVSTQIMHATGVSRTVDAIEVIGDYDDIDTSTGDFQWATKTLGNGQVIRADMSNLPGISDSV